MVTGPDRLARLLDGHRPDWAGDPTRDAELVDLATLARELEHLPVPGPDPQFRANLRDTLMSAAARTLPADMTPPDRRRPALLSRIPRARCALVAVAAVLVATASAVAVSADSAPGDRLYPVKRAAEDVQLAMTGGTAHAALHLDHAHRRAVEAATATGTDLTAVLDDLDADVHAGVRGYAEAAVDRDDASLLDPVDTAVADIREALWVAMAPADPSGRTRITGSLALLDTVDLRVAELRRGIELGCPPSGGDDELGPLPGECVALPPADERAPVAGVPPAATATVPPGGHGPGGPAPAAEPEPNGGTEPDSGSDPDSGGDDPPASPGLSPSPTPEPTDAPDGSDDDGGLLGGLGDLIDGLLGG